MVSEIAHESWSHFEPMVGAAPVVGRPAYSGSMVWSGKCGSCWYLLATSAESERRRGNGSCFDSVG
jgi:hypothetical protein